MASQRAGGVSVTEIAQRLPATFFVMRGHLKAAFGLTRNEVERLISNGVFVAEYPLGEGTRARFVRTQVLAAARKWESATRTIPK